MINIYTIISKVVDFDFIILSVISNRLCEVSSSKENSAKISLGSISAKIQGVPTSFHPL